MARATLIASLTEVSQLEMLVAGGRPEAAPVPAPAVGDRAEGGRASGRGPAPPAFLPDILPDVWPDVLPDILEVRADRVGDLSVAALRERFAGRLLYTLRSRAEGGAANLGVDERLRRIAGAVRDGYDLIDLEAERDLVPSLLDQVAPERRIVSWHQATPSRLEPLLVQHARMVETPAHLYKLVPAARQPGDELAPLALLHTLGRRDVAAFATGEIASWTRLVAPRLGAPVIYASLGDSPAAPGQLSLERLVRDFGLPELPPVAWLCGVVGNPISHSLSPRLHNAAYRALGLPGLYLPFHVESFGDFWLEVVESGSLDVLGLPLRGLSVTAPHKDVALAVAGAASPLAQRIGAANTLVFNDGVWEAENSDPDGILLSLAAAGHAVVGRRTVVVGCGGAGRAAGVGLAAAGAEVTMVNRGHERGSRVAAELGLPFLPLAELDLSAVEVAVHATSLGRDVGDELPFDPEQLPVGAAVVDLAYGGETTELVRRARGAGHCAIDGREVLLQQARRQFTMMTGVELPLGLGYHVLGLAAPTGAAGDGPEGSEKAP